MERVICENRIVRGDKFQSCNRYLGSVVEGKISLKCPKCGAVTQIRLSGTMTLEEFGRLLNQNSISQSKMPQA